MVEPRFKIFKTPGNLHTYDVLEAMVIDPRDREDALKTDADEYGDGGDDAVRGDGHEEEEAGEAGPQLRQRL